MTAASTIRFAILAGVATILLGLRPVVAEPLVYIPLGGENSILVVDAATDKAVDTINGIPAVHGLASTPDGRFLIAGSYEERAPGAGVPPKPSSVSEAEHAAHHSGTAGQARKEGASVSTVSVIRTADRSVVRRIDVPGAVHHVAVSANGRYAVVTHPNQGTVSSIDLANYRIVATVPTGPFPNYAAFAPDGARLYVSNAGNDSVSAIDVKTWTVSWQVTVGASPEHLVLSSDGGTLYVNNVDGGSVSIVDTDKREVAKTIFVGSTPHGIDLAGNGKTLFVTVLGDDKIVALDLATGTVRAARLAPAPYHVAVLRGLAKLYASSADEPKVWVVDQNSLAVLGEVRIGGKGHQMVLAPGT